MGYAQIAAVPYRRNDEGKVDILLITSRTRGRWIVPKGHVESKHGPRGSACLEALEEAGVEGSLAVQPLGTYVHSTPPPREVLVYLMAVDFEHDEWPESASRERRWFSLEEAIETVDEEGLRRLFGLLDERLGATGSSKAA